MMNYHIHTGLFETEEKKPIHNFGHSHSLFDLDHVMENNTSFSLESTQHSMIHPYTDPLYMNVRLPRLVHEWSAPHLCSQVQFEEQAHDWHDWTVQQLQRDNTANDVRGTSHEEVPQSNISDKHSSLGQTVDDTLEAMLHVRSHTLLNAHM